MSIADGQVVLVAGPGGAPAVDPAASISRIGGRAYPPALAALAPQLRFELAQAADALQFASDPGAPAVRRQAEFMETTWAALAQEPGAPVPLGEQASLAMHSAAWSHVHVPQHPCPLFLFQTRKGYVQRGVYRAPACAP